jgi:phenylacetate-CoA ligase
MTATHPSRDEIATGQLAGLRSLIAALIEGNPFYGPRLIAAGLGADVPDVATFTKRMAMTTKAMIVADQQAHGPYGTNLTYPLDRYSRYHQTSATSGRPMRWLDTEESWAWMIGNWRRVFAAAGVTRDDRVLFAFSFGPFLGFWTAFEAGTQIGCLCLPGGGLSSAARLGMLMDNRATVLCCTPTYALRLAEAAGEAGVDLRGSAVRVIIVAGEPGGSVMATRRAISGRWNGARVFDHHGMTEVGPVTYECPAEGGVLHVIEGSYVAEVVEAASGAAAEAGTEGELVLTTLGRVGSPLLRYRTGDLVRMGDRSRVCRCGSWEMRLEGGILGRLDDMVTIRGVNVFPSAVDEMVRSEPGVAEYRVEIDERGAMAQMRLMIELVNGAAAGEELVHGLEAKLRAALSLRVPVEVVATGTLPRFEMKASRWIRLRDGAAADRRSGA